MTTVGRVSCPSVCTPRPGCRGAEGRRGSLERVEVELYERLLVVRLDVLLGATTGRERGFEQGSMAHGVMVHGRSAAPRPARCVMTDVALLRRDCAWSRRPGVQPTACRRLTPHAFMSRSARTVPLGLALSF